MKVEIGQSPQNNHEISFTSLKYLSEYSESTRLQNSIHLHFSKIIKSPLECNQVFQKVELYKLFI